MPTLLRLELTHGGVLGRAYTPALVRTTVNSSRLGYCLSCASALGASPDAHLQVAAVQAAALANDTAAPDDASADVAVVSDGGASADSDG